MTNMKNGLLSGIKSAQSGLDIVLGARCYLAQVSFHVENINKFVIKISHYIAVFTLV